MPTVSSKLWGELLEQTSAFRSAVPWNDIPDSAMGAYIDSSGRPWFACVLGNAGQVFGFCFYRGATGLRFHQRVRELESNFNPLDHRFEQDALTVWYGPKSELPGDLRKAYEKAGYVPKRGDQLGWPDVRSHRPRYFPWFPEEDEVRFLIEAIPRLLAYAAIYREDPESYRKHSRDELPTIPATGPLTTLNDLEWRTWLKPTLPEIIPLPVDVADPVLRRAAALPQVDETLEVDWFYLPDATVEGGRPFYLRCVAVFRKDGGYCYGQELIGPEVDAARPVSSHILQAIEQLGARPKHIATTRKDLALTLETLATRLGAKTKVVRRLKSMDEFRGGLESFQE